MYHVQLHFFTRALAFPQTLSLWQRSPAAPAVALPVSITNAAQKGKEKRTPFAAWSVVSAQWIVLGQCQLRVGDWMEQQQTDLGGDSKSRGVFFCCFVFVSPSLAGSVAYFYGYTGLIMCIKYCHIYVCVCVFIYVAQSTDCVVAWNDKTRTLIAPHSHSRSRNRSRSCECPTGDAGWKERKRKGLDKAKQAYNLLIYA